jgi:hypothetical protein
MGFSEGAVLGDGVRRGDERHDGDVFVRLRFTELNRLQPRFHCIFQIFPFGVGEGTLRRILLTPQTILTRPSNPGPPPH